METKSVIFSLAAFLMLLVLTIAPVAAADGTATGDGVVWTTQTAYGYQFGTNNQQIVANANVAPNDGGGQSSVHQYVAGYQGTPAVVGVSEATPSDNNLQIVANVNLATGTEWGNPAGGTANFVSQTAVAGQAGVGGNEQIAGNANYMGSGVIQSIGTLSTIGAYQTGTQNAQIVINGAYNTNGLTQVAAGQQSGVENQEAVGNLAINGETVVVSPPTGHMFTDPYTGVTIWYTPVVAI